MKRVTGMTSGQSTYPISPGYFAFQRCGDSGFTFSSLLPHTARIADDLTFIRSLYSEHVNHDPALTFVEGERRAACIRLDRAPAHSLFHP